MMSVKSYAPPLSIKLTDEEYEIIKGHVEASIDIIRHLPSLDYVIPAVIGHHERYDEKDIHAGSQEKIFH